MKDKRIGVWFSIALAILALSLWLGLKLGAVELCQNLKNR
jgi:hypothetical protein